MKGPMILGCERFVPKYLEMVRNRTTECRINILRQKRADFFCFVCVVADYLTRDKFFSSVFIVFIVIFLIVLFGLCMCVVEIFLLGVSQLRSIFRMISRVLSYVGKGIVLVRETFYTDF